METSSGETSAGRGALRVPSGILARGMARLAQARGRLFPLAPVMLGAGIAVYFGLRWEPPLLALWGALGAGALGLLAARGLGYALAPLGYALALLALGFGWAGLRAHQVGGPVLDFRYYGAIEGRVVGIDRSASDAVRVTLDRVALDRVPPERVPRRVRVSLHGDQGWTRLEPGMVAILTGHLARPGGPVEPGGFDFRRHAWFLKLGAVGYTRSPVLMLEPPEPGLSVLALRMALADRVRAGLPGQPGAFAAAVLTGDRSGVNREVLTDLRHSNLAHLLAISGLHMGLLAGFVFGALRLGLALWPRAALDWPIKKIAATGALIAAAGYLALSGGNVATERAFVMVGVALVAVLFDRRALSLRGVALAALIVLAGRPETLLSPGFQMSFAATLALVIAFRWLKDREVPLGPRWLRPPLMVLITSAVAGAATAPVAALHFNIFSHYGLIANVAAVPLMGTLVVPAGVLAFLLMPVGLEGAGLWLMGLGTRWILAVADTVSGWEGAVRFVPSAPGWVLPVLAGGALWLALWPGRARLAGALVVLVAAFGWATSERPAVLIAEGGALVGVMAAEGRALSRPRGAGFAARVWLENDGDGAGREAASARWRPDLGRIGNIRILHVAGKTGWKSFSGCTAGDLLVSSVPVPQVPGCRYFDPETLARTGAVALVGDKLEMRTAADAVGNRLWSPQTARP